MSLRMLRRSPVILSAIRREHRILDILIKGHNIGGVISDNRFGIWSENIPSIYMTHQVSIKAPQGWSFTEGLLYMVHRKYIRHFDECWIPDTEENGGLSGELGHKRKSPVQTYYIGPQSRFELPDEIPYKKYDIMAMISGPEPQRSVLEEKIIDQLMNSGLKATVLLGKPEEDEHEVNGNIEMHSHLESSQLRDAILASDLIICRSGYSSIMDLAALGKQAALIPTPGQTEQEYLAWYHQYKQHFFSMPQEEFKLVDILQESKKYKGINHAKDSTVLEERINNLLESL
jgi:UDP-N-acetylglucosamine transferase subunit ALG13